MRFENLGSFIVNGTGLNKFTVSTPTKEKKLYLSELVFLINVQGTAINAITKKDFAGGICSLFNLNINNVRVCENMDFECLYKMSLIGTQHPVPFPEVSSAGSYSVNFIMPVNFSIAPLLEPHDFAFNTTDIERVDFEFQRGEIPNSSEETFTIYVYAKLIQRDNEYHCNLLNYRKITVSKQISDIIPIVDRCLFAFFKFNLGSDLGTPIILKTNRKIILDNLPLYTLMQLFNIHMIFEQLSESDYNHIYLPLVPDSKVSINKPLLFENENIFFDKMPPLNSPFDFITLCIRPNEFVGETITQTRYSPIIQKE